MLSLNSLQAGYNGQSVVSLPPLSLAPKATCLIRGTSGSGKTTLLHTIGGLQAPVSGSVSLNGTDLYSLNESSRDHLRGQKISLIFQTLHLIKCLSVMENLMLAQHVSGQNQDHTKALSLLDRLGIADLKDRPAHTLSQGQSQRVAIVRALLKTPSVILADEPTSSLDDVSCQKTINLLKELSHEASAVLVVTSHDSRIFSAFDQTLTLES